MDENSPRYAGWRVAAASGVGVFFTTIVVYSFAVLLKPLAAEYGWSRQEVSAAYAVMALASAVAAPFLGRLFDRFGPRRIILPCLASTAAAFASLVALTPNLWHLYLVFAAVGSVVIGTTPLGYSRAVSTWFDRRRGTALAVVLAAAALGGIVHPPATQALVARIGWRGACLLLGAVFLVVGGAAVAAFVRERPAAPSATGGSSSLAGASVRAALASPVFWVLIVMIFASNLAFNGAIVHVAAMLTDRGVAAERAATAVSAMGAAGLLGRLLTGWLLDRFRGPRVACGLLVCASLGTFLLATAETYSMGLSAAALIGAGSGGELDVAPYLLSRYFGLRSLSALYGLVWTAMGLAGAIGPVLLGRAFDATGSYAAVLTAFAMSTLAIAAVMLALPGYDPRYAPPAAVPA